MNSTPDALAIAVEKLHGGKATFERTEAVEERAGDLVVWKGSVSVYKLTEHTTATLCYAWIVPADVTHRERYIAVLHAGKIDSPAQAVRASLLAESRSKKS